MPKKTKNKNYYEYAVGVNILGQPIVIRHYYFERKKTNGKI